MTEEQIFSKALELPAERRAGFWDGFFHDLPDDRAKIGAMIRAHEQSDSLSIGDGTSLRRKEVR